MIRLASIWFLVLLLHPAQAQNLDYAREVVQTLASPAFKGRGFTGNGHYKAARYISREFEKMGLASLTGKTYFQPFNIKVNTFPAKMKVVLDGITMEEGSEFLVHPASPSINGNFAVYPIKITDLSNSDVVEKIRNEVSGKIILIDEREEEENASGTEDVLRAILFGRPIPSAGTIILTNKKLTWGISTALADKPVIMVNSKRLSRIPSEAKISINARFGEHETNNVIGYIPGRVKPDSFLVLTAHYDHLGNMGSKIYFPGANDNASGVAMLLNLTTYFKSNPHDYSIVFMALAAEETGLNGARYFVENPLFDLSRIVFLVNFDLAGTGDDGIKVVNGSVHARQFEMLKKINVEKGYLKDVQIRGPACNSDHCMFHEKGVPCFYIYTLGGIAAYHDIYDRFETLPLTEFRDYMHLMIDFLSEIH